MLVDGQFPDYKQVIHERLYLKEPGTERFRKTSAGHLKRLLAEGWRETERWHAEDHITVPPSTHKTCPVM